MHHQMIDILFDGAFIILTTKTKIHRIAEKQNMLRMVIYSIREQTMGGLYIC